MERQGGGGDRQHLLDRRHQPYRRALDRVLGGQGRAQPAHPEQSPWNTPPGTSRANCVAPGLMDTPFILRGEGRACPTMSARATRRSRNTTPARSAKIPMRRMGDGWDVARAALFPRLRGRRLYHRPVPGGRRRGDRDQPRGVGRRREAPTPPPRRRPWRNRAPRCGIPAASGSSPTCSRLNRSMPNCPRPIGRLLLGGDVLHPAGILEDHPVRPREIDHDRAVEIGCRTGTPDDVNAPFPQPVIGLHHVVDVFDLMVDVLDAAVVGGEQHHRMVDGCRCAGTAIRRGQSDTRALQIPVQNPDRGARRCCRARYG